MNRSIMACLAVLMALSVGCSETSVLEGRWNQTSTAPLVVDEAGGQRYIVVNLGHYGSRVAGYISFFQSSALLVPDTDCGCWVIENGWWLKRDGDSQTKFSFEFRYCKDPITGKQKRFIASMALDSDTLLTGTISEFKGVSEPDPAPQTFSFGQIEDTVPHAERKCPTRKE